MSMTQPRASPLALKHAHLKALIEKYAERSKGIKGLSEVHDVQRRLITSLQECAEATLGVAEHGRDVICPRDIACLHRGDWNHCNACFKGHAERLFDQAGKLLTAAMLCTEPGPPVRAISARAGPDSCETFPQRTASFTGAQQRVFDLLMTGLPNKLIAYEIGVSEATVKAHVSAVLHKLKVRSRTQAIALSSAFERTRSEQFSGLSP